MQIIPEMISTKEITIAVTGLFMNVLAIIFFLHELFRITRIVHAAAI